MGDLLLLVRPVAEVRAESIRVVFPDCVTRSARSAWPVISKRKRLACVSRLLPHLRRVSESEIASVSRARVMPT